MKLIDVFNKIAKGEIKDGTIFVNETEKSRYTYEFRDGRLKHKYNSLDVLIKQDELNDEVEIIEPKQDIAELIVCVGDTVCGGFDRKSDREEIWNIYNQLNKTIDTVNKVIRKVNEIAPD